MAADPPPAQEALLWASSRSVDRISRTRWRKEACHFARQARATYAQKLDEVGIPECETDSIIGFVFLVPSCIYAHHLPMSQLDRSLWDFWADCWRPGDKQDMYVYKVEHYQTSDSAEPWSTLRASPICSRTLFQLLPAGNFMRLLTHAGLELDDFGEDNPPVVAIRLPAPIATLLVAGCIQSLILPDCATMRMGWRPALTGRWSRGSFRATADPLSDSRNFNVLQGRELADVLRGVAGTLRDGTAEAHDRVAAAASLSAWINRLHNTVSPFSSRALMGVKRAERAKHLIECLMLADNLSADSSFRDVLVRTVRILFDSEYSNSLLDMLAPGAKVVRIFDQSELSRGRLTVDVAFMAWHRKCNAEKESLVRYILVDSSPQFGRDYQIILTKQIKSADLLQLWELSTAWYWEWRAWDDAVGVTMRDLVACVQDDGRLGREATAMEKVIAAVAWHVAPAVQIGFGASSLYHKLHSVFHAIRLELSSHRELVEYWQQVHCICSDYGTEYKLAYLRPVRDMLPYWRDTAVDEAPAALEDEDDALLQPPRPDIPFSHLLAHDGILHTIDNATKDLGTAMTGFKLVIRKLKSVCRLVRKKGSQDKLVQRCFEPSPVARHFIDDIRKFQGSVHLGRWGSIAFALPQIIALQHPLRYAFSLNRFRQGSREKPEDESDATDTDDELRGQGRADVADRAIHDPTWWAYLIMLEEIAKLLRRLTHWAEWCPCHGDLVIHVKRAALPDALKARVLKHWSKCPLRGCRGPCLANGEFNRQVESLGTDAAFRLLARVPGELGPAQRRDIIAEFHACRAYLRFYFELKLHHWTQPPWLVYKIAHWNPLVATDGLDACLASDDPHPLVRKLHHEPLWSDIARATDGATIGEPGTEHLAQFAATLRFAWTAERWVEVAPCLKP